MLSRRKCVRNMTAVVLFLLAIGLIVEGLRVLVAYSTANPKVFARTHG